MSPTPALTAPALTAPALTAPALTAPALTAPALTAPAEATAFPVEPYLAQLAHLIAEHGVHAFEGDIARFSVRLRAVGHHSPAISALLGILSDRSAAPVARERAFGHLLCIVLDGTTRGPLTQTAATEDCCARDAA